MLDDLRRYVQSRIGARPDEADDLPDALRSGAQSVLDQVTSLASGFLHWTAEARESLVREVRDMVTRQIEEMGVATKRDLETLRRRLDRLEAGGSASGGSRARSGRTQRRTVGAARKTPGGTVGAARKTTGGTVGAARKAPTKTTRARGTTPTAGTRATVEPRARSARTTGSARARSSSAPAETPSG